MKRLLLLLAVMISLSMSSSAQVFAHAGATDEDGGHYDYSTGEYHYHHGYPAHYHYDVDGDGKEDCPHDFEDRTGWNSGSSSGGNSYSENPFSSSYLDGYSEGHEAGYYDGYRDGQSSGYSSGYDVGYDYGYDYGYKVGHTAGETAAEDRLLSENQIVVEEATKKTKANAYSTSGCIGGGILALSCWASQKRKKKDAASIDEAKEETAKKKRELLATEKELETTKDELRVANIEKARIQRESITFCNQLSVANQQIENLKADIDTATQLHKSKMSKAILEIASLQQILETKIGSSAHAELVELHGEDYLYVLAKAPSGDYLDDKGFPHSKGSDKFRSSDKYTFYLGGSTYNPSTKYHTLFCRHANAYSPINARTLSNTSRYIPCAQCSPRLPDVSWVERYLVFRNAMDENAILVENSETIEQLVLPEVITS